MRRMVLSMLLAALFAMATSTIGASAATNRSCVGTVSSGIRGQTIDRDEGSAIVKAMAAALGVPPGDLYSDFAANHLGSVSACFAAPPAP